MESKRIKNILIKLGFFISVLLFVTPSIIFFIKNGTTYVSNNLEYKFLLRDDIDNKIHMIGYLVVIALMIGLYTIIIKKRRELFKSIKDVYKFIIVISLLCAVGLPFMSSDIYYYLGIGRLSSKYRQNPYYVDMKSYIDDNDIDTENDSVMETGYKNYWANTTVVYGALWTMICTIVAFFSFGSLNTGILIFKLLNVLIHILNCFLLYKLSRRKLFPLLYGLNPFALIEGIINVHNDIHMVFFIIFSLYMLKEKKQIIWSILFVAFATLIKYVAILLLPLIIIYHYRARKIGIKIIKCLELGLLFCIFVMIPYLLYIRDINVFNGIVTQQGRYAKGLYCYIMVVFPQYVHTITYIKAVCSYGFVLLYFLFGIKLLISKNVKWYKEVRKTYMIFLYFLIFMLTNFQPWYFIWLSAIIVWQKADNIKLITQMQIIMLIANSVFVLYSEAYIYAKQFFVVFVVSTWICMLFNISKRIYRYKKLELKTKN